MQLSPVSQIANRVLRKRSSVLPFGHLPPLTRDIAIAWLGTGCNHLVGEQLVAVVLPCASLDDSFAGGILTDRRIRWMSTTTERKSYRVSWTDLATVDVKKSLLFGPSVSLGFCDGSALGIPQVYADVAALPQELVRMSPAQRALPDHGLLQANEGDPTGAHTALATAVGADPQLDVLCRGALAGWMAGSRSLDDARDAIARATLLHRGTFFGRGSPSDSHWLSPLTPADAATALACIFGAPIRHRKTDDGVVYTYRVPEPLLRRTAIAPGSVVVVGSPNYTRWRMKSATWVEELSIEVAELDGLTRLLVGKPLSHDNPSLLTLVFRELERREAQLLLLRMAFGDEPSAASLLTVSRADVAAHVCARIGPVDLSPFGA